MMDAKKIGRFSEPTLDRQVDELVRKINEQNREMLKIQQSVEDSITLDLMGL